MKTIKKNLSDILLISGLLFLSSGVYVEYGLGKALITCGSLVILMGYKLIPIRKG